MIKFYGVLIFPFLFLSLFAEDLSAQQFTFFEGFDETDAGTLPEGWSAWQNGGGGNAPSPMWRVERDSQWGVEQYALSLEEAGREGLIDEDWMITPNITPKEGDFLIFSTRRGYDDTGDNYQILISKSSNEAPAAFTEILASYTSEEMPTLTTNFTLDLSEYADVPIHIAFVHSCNVGPDAWSSV